MHTFENIEAAAAQAADAQAADAQSAESVRLMAYGRKVQELLSQSDASEWVADLWDMYTGFTLFTQEAGYDPNGHNKFVNFKELVFFFQDVGRVKEGR